MYSVLTLFDQLCLYLIHYVVWKSQDKEKEHTTFELEMTSCFSTLNIYISNDMLYRVFPTLPYISIHLL